MRFLFCDVLLSVVSCRVLQMMPVLLRRLAELNSIEERPLLACKLAELLQAVLEWDQLKVLSYTTCRGVFRANKKVRLVKKNLSCHVLSVSEVAPRLRQTFSHTDKFFRFRLFFASRWQLATQIKSP